MLSINELIKAQKIAIIGLGKENMQFLNWLLKVVKMQPDQIILADQKSMQTIDIEGYSINDFENVLGEKYLTCLENEKLEYVFKAPGIWSLKKEFVDFRRQKGEDRILSGLVFFMQHFRRQIVGITGTKGKSTTCSLVNHLLNGLNTEKKPIKSHYCGNTTGISPYTFWQDLDQELLENEYFVVELSSFQLQDLGYAKISPKYAVITNYYVDHLDQHLDIDEYWQSKNNLFKWQEKTDTLVITEQLRDKIQLETHNNFYLIDHSDLQNIAQDVSTHLIGEHNLSNLTEAIFITSIVALYSQNKQEIYTNLTRLADIHQTFQPLSHRLELLQKIDLENVEINIYDDGFATEPDAVIAAVKALTKQENQFLWLWITGKDKGGDLGKLAEILWRKRENIYKLNLHGEVGKNLAQCLNQASQSNDYSQDSNTFQNGVVQNFTSLTDIKKNFEFWLNQANSQASQKYHKLELNIVLSPCGSSFDEFENYIQRADFWIGNVNKQG